MDIFLFEGYTKQAAILPEKDIKEKMYTHEMAL